MTDKSCNDVAGHTKLPTLFSTSGVATKCAILTSLPHFLRGSARKLTSTDALQVVQALTNKDLIDCANEELLLCLVNALRTSVDVFTLRGFIATPDKQLPETIKADVKQRTLDSIVFYSALCLRHDTFASVQAAAAKLIDSLSRCVTGDGQGIYNIHAKRLLYRYGTSMPVGALRELVLNTGDSFLPSKLLKDMFVYHLSQVNFALRVVNELQYFQVLEQLL
uniref:Uncharacterized protein n=1 Tax=Lygus hesperus TaxID=30085 RepID=A0A146L7C4_LYGHE